MTNKNKIKPTLGSGFRDLSGDFLATKKRIIKIIEENYIKYGYQEINLNVGCPSDRVQNGRFGACLMAEPQLVADCIAAMKAETNVPVTVKTRIGIDEQDSYEFLIALIEANYNVGCRDFIIHARKAWLQGLSPKENREIPPLDYDREIGRASCRERV